MIDITNELAVLQSLYEGIQSMLKGFESTRKPQITTNLRLQCATILQTSEKAILKQTLQVLTEKISQLPNH
jgi:hypothetical protein